MNRANGVILATSLVISGAASAGTLREARNPEALPPANGYSHVVIAPKGRLVSISGQVALDKAGKLVGGNDFEAQCVQVHENLKAALADVGLTFKDVVRTDNYIVNRADLTKLRDVRARYLPKDAPPTSTLLVVDGLFRPDLLVEVAVEAVLPDGRPLPPAR